MKGFDQRVPYLVITRAAGAVGRVGNLSEKFPRLYFALEEGFEDEYQSEIRPLVGMKTTHPLQQFWKHGSPRPLSIKVRLRAGVGIVETAKDVVGIVERLYSWALPYKYDYLATLSVLVGCGKSIWFHRTGVLQSVRVNFLAPYDVNTGEPHNADLQMVFMPHLGLSTGHKLPTDVNGRPSRAALPHPPWGFTKTWGFDRAVMETKAKARGSIAPVETWALTRYLKELVGIGPSIARGAP